jgi:trimeric autotransporter adhesin
MRCLRSLLAILTALIAGSSLIAQNPAVLPRIAGPVDEKSMVALAGNVSSLARAEFDRGEAPASTQLSHVRLVLARSSEQQAALDKYDAELLDKTSPNYHKWLTPEQFGKLYGPADSDIAAIIAWLESHGLQVHPVSLGRTTIAFSGTVQQIEELLHTSIHSYEINGEQFYSNTSNPKIPAALAPVISGVARLNTMQPKPQHVMGKMGLNDPDTGRLQATSQAALRGPRANLTTGSGTAADPYTLFLVPGDAATIYDTPNSVLNASYPSTSTSYTGTGITIGIGGDATINPATVASYRQRFLGDSKQPTVINVDNTIQTGDSDEAYLDNEIAGGLAPGANLRFYTGSTIDLGIDKMLNESPVMVDIFSLSFGLCELGLTTADNATINGWWQQAATEGIAVTVSTGDDGSAACDQQPPANSGLDGVASSGLMVSGFASTPFNIAVGGTDFGPLLTTFTTFANPTSSNSATIFYRTALKYIPEWTWNDSTTVNTTLSANVPFLDSSNLTNIVAGSGGMSNCSTNSTTATTVGTCTSGYAKPTWQRGAGVPNDSARDIPDISLMAGAGGDAAAWLVCTDEQGTVSGATVTANCTTQADGHFYFFGFGGTSTSAPAFAGILAMAQQKAGHKLGQAASELYDLYNGAHAAAIFHDVTIGNISVPCVSATPDCQTNTAGHLFLTGYDTTTGYDLATGIGSVDAVQLVNFWGTATGAATTIVTVTPSTTTLARADAMTVDITVKGSAATGNPTGTVVLAGGGFTSTAQTLITSGTDSATVTGLSIPGNSLAKGTDTLTASYSGDTNYAAQTGTATVTVTAPTPTVTVVPASLTPNSGAALNVTVTVAGPAGSGTPTGNVTLTGGAYNSGAKALDATGKFVFTIPAFTFTTAGAVTLTANYAGDPGFNAASGTAGITVAVSTFTVSATDVTVTAGATTGNTSTVTITPVAGYTGSVTLTAAITAPTNAANPPTLTPSGAITITNATPVTGTVTVGTTAATAARQGGSGSAWYRAAGGTALAAFLLFFVPLGSRRGRRMLSVLLVLAAATFTAVGCGGGGGGGSKKTTPSVTVSPSKTTFSSDTAITAAVSVSGGTQAATGTVTLSGGGFTGTATSLSAGAATINIPANSLTAGSVTLTASYSGDSNYNAATGTSTVTVNKPKTTPGAYTVTVTATGNDAAHTTKTATFTLTVN